MDGYPSDGDDAERRRRRISDAARKRGARRWLNWGSRPPRAFERRELDEYEELALRRRRHSSGSSSVAGSSSAGPSCSRLTPVKREPEELGPAAVKLEADEHPPRRGIVGPEDYLPPGQEEHLERVILERSAREEEARRRAILDIDDLLFEQGVVASQAQTSKDADLRVLKKEQAAIWIQLDSSDEE